MNFLKFPSIRNPHSVSLSLMNELRNENRIQWVVTEKIDGANIQIGKDENGKVFYGRRNGFLGEGSSFYNFFQIFCETLNHEKEREF